MNERYNYIVKVGMTAEELHGFKKMSPLISVSMNLSESNMIARLLGYKSIGDLANSGFSTNPFLKNAFSILSFLYISREDMFTFNDFWKRLIFTDKDVEKKVRRTFNIPKEDDVLSTEQLELMYLMDTERDELDGKNLG